MDKRFAVTHREGIEFFEDSELTSLFQGYMHKFYKKTDIFVIKKNTYAFFQHLFQRFRFSLKRHFVEIRRSSDSVQLKYEGIWDQMEWSELLPDHPREYFIRWRDRYYLGNVWALPRVHLAFLEKIIAHYRPQKVLEVGSGRGLNLILLAARFPEIEFTGLELSESGVLWAEKVNSDSNLPPELLRFSPFKWNGPRIPGKVHFVQGTATKLPFADRHFDLVYTRQALEQMEPYRDQVFSEIHRVCNRVGVFIEAFRDWNKSGTQRHRIIAKDYFSARISDLRGYGFEPILTKNDLPTKSYMNVGLVLAQKL